MTVRPIIFSGPMKALTVWQPWSSLIAIGAKPYEFRGWKPPASLSGQRIAIHAGARPPRRAEIKELIQRLQVASALTPCLVSELALPLLERAYRNLEMLPLSHIVCTAVVGTPKRGDECAREFGVHTGNDSDRPGTFNWGWPMLDVQALEPPIPARGAQGLWNWSGA